MPSEPPSRDQWTPDAKATVCMVCKVERFSMVSINTFVTNGLSHPYHLDESTFIFRVIRSNFSFLFHFWREFISANRISGASKQNSPRSGAILFAYVP